MISFVERNARSTPGISAYAAPPAAPARIIAPIETADGLPASRERAPRRRDRARVELALAADVEELHPECDRGREAGEDERRRRDEGRGERAVGRERGVDQATVRADGAVACQDEHDPGEHDR